MIKKNRKIFLITFLLLFIFISTYFLIFRTSSVGASATVGTGELSASVSSEQRDSVVTSTGTLVKFYETQTDTPAGLDYRTSTNSGTSWSSPTSLGNVTDLQDFSVAIDSSNNIYVVFNDDSFVNINNNSIYIIKLTYSSGSWSAGSTNSIFFGTLCNGSTIAGVSYSKPTITIDSGGKLWVNALKTVVPKVSCVSPTFLTVTSQSTDASTWTVNGGTLACGSAGAPITAIGTALWTICPSLGIYKDLTGSGAWTQDNATTYPTTGISLVSRISTELNLYYKNASNQIVERTYTTSPASLAAETIISSTAGDALGQISTSGTNLYASYVASVGVNQSNITYKLFNGTTWSSAVSVTTNNVNNVHATSPANRVSSFALPIFWVVGTASPFTVTSDLLIGAALAGGPNYATTAADDTTIGAQTWSNPSNAQGASNGTIAQSSSTSLATQTTHYLKMTNFSFNIPAGSTINGIQVEFLRGYLSTNFTAVDNAVRIVQGGVIGTTDRSTGTAWSDTSGPGLRWDSYGGSSDLWGLSWTPSDINNPTFGTALSASIPWSSISGVTTAEVDAARITITYSLANNVPAVPTLLSPASGVTGTSTAPLFQLRATDADADYLRYKILLYNSDCATGLQTFDQTSSQNGWAMQDSQSGTAYTGSATLSSSTIAKFGLANLSPSTTYCWKAAAIDPGGSNTFGSFSATQLFTTGAANAGVVNINGGTNINGGSIVR